MRAGTLYAIVATTFAVAVGALVMASIDVKRIGASAIFSLPAFTPRPAAAQMNFAHKTEEASVELKPGYSVEAKVGMRKGTRVDYAWSVTGGAVFFDKHGEREEGEKSYEWGRDSSGASGVLEAAFDGSHGWLWRNSGRNTVRITVRTKGEFNFLLTSPATNR
jgi:hypothetical protein